MSAPRWLWMSALAALLSAVGASDSPALPPREEGIASFYGWRWHGRTMANGRPFHALGPTAASRTLPLGTRVIITNTQNGRSSHATIEDRGPYVAGRDIDVSLGVARELGMERDGLAHVVIDPVGLAVETRHPRKRVRKLFRRPRWLRRRR